MSLETGAFKFVERTQRERAQEIVKIGRHSSAPSLLSGHTCRPSMLIIQPSVGVITPYL